MNKTYSFKYVPVEVRSKHDPYVVWSENEYETGKDNTNIAYVF